ncbi:phosphoribosylformylglycinamidine cyclo-ligase [Candidatus Woesearchaeota archaeon]|nr:phosphoribosylformylglycinamidine cyclo-ligase [Candidatus Woesearchaeota archaeon]|tara:strand:+ start:22399 stop:23427 length:1029 start_codon:yes stop_codon:yes gene_type:complete
MTSYKEAGVDVEAKEKAIEEIKESVKETFTDDVLSASTTFKFGGTISLKRLMGYNDPVLVLSTDGVGTKMVIAEKMKKFDTVGVDILNHSINDVLTSGAKAMFFLDYIGASRLDVRIVKEMVVGIAKECKKKSIILAGGETAEMPGVYHDGTYELTGTVGGIVERENIIDGSKIKEGDVLIGLASSGLHTNGYSLARKIFFDDNNYSCDDDLPEIGKLGDALLATHKEYANSVLPLVEKKLINGIIHVTGGGFPGNIPRIMPQGLGAKIKLGSWEVPSLFQLIQNLGRVNDYEMFKTFNMGIGLVLVVDKEKKNEVIEMLNNEKVHEIGEVIAKEGIQYESS